MPKFKDLTGKKFHMLTVVRFIRMSNQGSVWECLCDCGNIIQRSVGSFKHNKSCGCLRKEGIRKKLMKDMTGKKFGKWIVLHRDYQAKIGTGVHTRWICQCECGQIKSVDGKTIRRGKSTQCTKCKNRKDFKITEEPLYKLLSGMKDRCYNESNGRFARYGGRGICVCEEWLQSYQKFKEWAMENGYIQGHRLTIERIDNDDGYNPNNCRFATYAEQSRNKSNNHYVFIDGKKMILMDALRLAGTPPSTYKTRIKLGWDENDAIWGRNKEAKKE